MFKKFFQRKPKTSSKDLQLERIETLDSSSPQHLSQLLELAKSDPDPNIRSAAASRIGLRDCLAGLLKDEQDPLVRSRLVKLLFKQCNDDDSAIEMATSLLRHADSDQARIALLADVQHPAAATFITARIQDPQALIKTAVEHKISRVRLAAAQQLEDEAQLHELSHLARDKSVNQWVRARLKELKEQRQQAEQEQLQLVKLLEDIEQLSTSENPVNYRQRTQRLQDLFQELAPLAGAEQSNAIQSQLSICGTRADAYEQAALEALKPPVVAPEIVVEAPATEEVEAEEPVLDDPTAAARETAQAKLSIALQSEEVMDADAIRSLLTASQTEWHNIGQDQPEHAFHRNVANLEKAATSQDYLAANSDALAALCETPIDDSLDDETLHTLRSNLKDYLDVLSWPANWAAPSVLQALRATHVQAKDMHQQRRDQSRKRAQQLDKKIHRMGDAVRRKNLRLANNIHREVQETLPKFSGQEQRKLQQHLDKHLPEFNKLLDWHEYSATPKKEELCVQMEALIEREQAPEVRAEAVKALRAEWRTVTAANVQKDDPMWERFNGAAEQAYAPCEPFFEKLNQQKRDNLSQRERLTDELEQLMAGINWEEPPFEMLDKVLRTARAEWTLYTPVHFPDAKPCQKRFDAAMDKVHSALQQSRKRNSEQREQLINRATALSDLEDVDSAIAQALKLQDEWKAVGPVTPQMQRRQWAQFRKSMDAIFAKRQAARDSSNAEVQEQRTAVTELIDQLEAHANRPEEQLSQVAEEVRQLQDQIHEASQELPKKLQTGLMRRQNDLLNSIAEKQKALPLRRRARAYAALSDLASACHQAETAALEGQTADTASLASSTADSQWQSLLQSRVDSISNGTEHLRSQQADNLNSLENLAIELELLAEVDTPDAYRGQRRAWQLDMLESGAGNDGVDAEDKFFEVLQRWHAVGVVDQEARAQLNQRLAAACKPFAKLLHVGTQAAPTPVAKVATEEAAPTVEEASAEDAQ